MIPQPVRRLKSLLFITRLAGALTMVGLISVAALLPQLQPARAATGINQQMNYQGRLLNAAGAVVPDGTYNIEFKMYSGGTGCVASGASPCGGTNIWTEDWVYGTGAPDNRLVIRNGYFSVQLGALSSLSAVNLAQDTLWISINIGNTTTAASFATASGDGEMLPFKRLSAGAYAFTANQLAVYNSGNTFSSTLNIVQPTGGSQIFQIPDQGAAGTYNLLTTTAAATGYVQLQGGTPGTAQTGNINITGTALIGTALTTPILQSAAGVALLVDSGTTGALNIGTGANAKTIQIGTTTGAVAQIINIGTNATAASTSTVTIGSTIGTSPTTIKSGSSGISLSGNTTITGTLQGSTATLTGTNSLTLGTLSSATGSIIVNNATNAFTSTIQGNTSATASYTSILPGAVGTAGQCLALSSVVTTTQTLGYATCGGAGGANAQLSNLSGTVAINLSLLSAANNTLNLGSAANVWQNTYTGVVDAGTAGTLGVGSVNATTVTVGNAANTTTASIVANTTLNLGNNANNKTVNIGATGTTANTSAVNIANTTSTGGASTVQIGGTGVTSGSNAGSTVTAQGGQTSLNVATAGATLKTFTDSATAFRVQSSTSKNVIGVDTAGGIVTVGQASGLTGQLTFANATNAFTSTITGNIGATASYTSVLPGAVGTAGQCLAVASVATTTQTLGYAACGGGGGGTLQAAYTASTDPEFALGTASTAGITIRDNATPISGNLLELQNSTGTISYFGATSTGILLQRAAATTALSFTFSTGELRVYDTGVSGNYAAMSYASNTATFAASAGITQIGGGAGSGGNINLVLTGAADQLLTSKTNTLAAAYSVNDFKFTRNLTASSFAVTGNVMTVEDITAFTSGSSAPNVLYVNQNNSSATGNLILAQTGGGANDRFKVTTAGNATLFGSATLGGGVSIGAGQSYSGAGAVTLQSGAGTALTLTSNAASAWSTTAGALTVTSAAAAIWSTTSGNLTLLAGGANAVILKPGTDSATAVQVQNAIGTSVLNFDTSANRISIGVSDTIGTLLVLDTKTDAADPTGVNGGMYYNSNANRFRCYENGAWADCLGYRHLVTLGSDVASTAVTTFQDVTGLSFPAVSGMTHRFKATIAYTNSLTTIGSRWSVNGPMMVTLLTYQSNWTSSATAAATTNASAYDTGATTTTSIAGTEFATVEGIIVPSANGTFIIRFAPETATASGVVVKAGSTLEWW